MLKHNYFLAVKLLVSVFILLRNVKMPFNIYEQDKLRHNSVKLSLKIFYNLRF